MTDQRVSLFVSHKVQIHRRAAARIKAILEARTERLDVHICEDIPAGDQWRSWIEERLAHSQVLLVLLPQAAADLTWIAAEIARFGSVCPSGRLAVLKFPGRPVPDIVRDRQIIDISREDLRERFLKPLYRESTFTGLPTALNPRVSETHIAQDAEEIEAALHGIADLRVQRYGESLIVETHDLDVTTADGLAAAVVRAPNGCSILNWNRRAFTWSELKAKAEEDRGKGTFWVSEMAQVIVALAKGSGPGVMTSTFRGRGAVAGQIFRPQLERADFAGDTPVRFHFTFHPVLVPELVRGQGHIGDVFNLLHLATRVRWEVLHPFLVNVSLARELPPSQLELSEEEQHDLMGRVRTSLRIIEVEVERHHMIDVALDAFDGADRNLVAQLLKKRDWIRSAIDAAANRHDFAAFMNELATGLTFNCEATEVLATKYLQLVRDDRHRVTDMLRTIASREVELN